LLDARVAHEPCSWSVVIVGGGPAGAAAGIRLAQVAPHLAARTLIVDRADFPRTKPCGGGLAKITDDLLDALGLHIDVPSVWIDELCFLHPGGETRHREHHAFRIVRREDFDAALLDEARNAGVTVREGESVRALSREPDGIRIETDRAVHRAAVIIGADGARSLVRRAFVPPTEGATFVAIETTTPEDGEREPAFRDGVATFDFRDVPDGLHGYAWDFPSIMGGVPTMNRGVGGIRWPRGGSPGTRLGQRLARQGIAIDPRAIEGAAVPLYHPHSAQSAPRVLLAGDAVGIDPLMGEGISVAIATGMMAGHAAADAIASGDVEFAGHAQRIAGSPIGQRLQRNWMMGPYFYKRLRDGNALAFPRGGLV
jgi:flavin-dependent dehydrogenase